MIRYIIYRQKSYILTYSFSPLNLRWEMCSHNMWPPTLQHIYIYIYREREFEKISSYRTFPLPLIRPSPQSTRISISRFRSKSPLPCLQTSTCRRAPPTASSFLPNTLLPLLPALLRRHQFVRWVCSNSTSSTLLLAVHLLLTHRSHSAISPCSSGRQLQQ